MYTDYKSRTYNQWGASMYQAAIGMGWGCNCIWWLQELLWGYLADWKVLPVNPYRDWNKSLLVNKNLCNEISIYLMSIGNEISAKRLMEFLHKPDIKEKYGIEKNISLWTACQYLNTLGYQYRAMLKGQYVNGHEHEDVVSIAIMFSCHDGAGFKKGWLGGMRN
jgi:hypothetical protein